MSIFHSNVPKTAAVLGLWALIGVVSTGGASAQTGARAMQRAQSAQLDVSVGTVSTEDLLEAFCDSSTVKKNSRGSRITYTCVGGSASSTSRLASQGAGPQRSKIHADCKDGGDGKPTGCICTCTADEESNCSNFIFQCSESDGEVGGNKSSATCKP
jgi:hypothetical protein